MRVYNPVDLKDFDYRLKINPVINSLDSSLVDTSSHWVLEWYQNGTLMGSYTSHNSIGNGTEEFLEGHGIYAVAFQKLLCPVPDGIMGGIASHKGSVLIPFQHPMGGGVHQRRVQRIDHRVDFQTIVKIFQIHRIIDTHLGACL